MAILISLDVVMASRKVSSKDLAETIGLSATNLSLLKQGHVKGVRFETLNALCRALDCAPGDVLKYVPDR